MTNKKELETFLSDLAIASEAMRMGEPEDIRQLRRLPGAMGQSLTITMFSFQQAEGMKSNLNFLLKLADKHDEPWVSTVTGELLASPIKTFGKRYQLTNSAALLERAAGLAVGLSGDEMIPFLRRLLEYFNFLSRQLRSLLPFHELSVTFEGYRYMSERATPPSKGKTRERAQ
jgi:hypothetical protein